MLPIAIKKVIAHLNRYVPNDMKMVPYQFAEAAARLALTSDLKMTPLWVRHSVMEGNVIMGVSDLDISLWSPEPLQRYQLVRVHQRLRQLKWLIPYMGELNYFDEKASAQFARCANPYEVARDPILLDKMGIKPEGSAAQILVYLLRNILADRKNIMAGGELRLRKWKTHFRKVGHEFSFDSITPEHIISSFLELLPDEEKHGSADWRHLLEFILSKSFESADLFRATTPRLWKIAFPHKYFWGEHDFRYESDFSWGDFDKEIVLGQIDWEVWGILSQRHHYATATTPYARHLWRLRWLLKAIGEYSRLRVIKELEVTLDDLRAQPTFKTQPVDKVELHHKLKPFCLAPFYHAHIDTEGNNRLCCISDNSVVEERYLDEFKLPQEKFWNSAYMLDRRKKMRQGEIPPECHLCVRKNKFDSYNEVFNRTYGKRFVHHRAKNDIKLPWQQNPVSLDIRTSVCNLKCRVCYPGSSTAMSNTFLRKMQLLDQYDVKIDGISLNRDMNNRSAARLKELVSTGEVESLYFAGGEPTMTPGHMEVLQDFVEKIGERDSIVCYNTNLAFKPGYVAPWMHLLNEAKHTVLNCSLDGVGVVGEYIREGLEFEKFEKNLDAVIELKADNVKVLLDYTITSLGILELDRFCDFAIRKKVKVTTKLMIGMELQSSFLRLEYLPLKIRKRIVQAYKENFARLGPEDRDIVACFQDILPLILSTPEMDSVQIARANQQAEFYDEMYPQKPKFKALFEEKRARWESD